jgi:tetratricopeptide (TPR) repeat protein
MARTDVSPEEERRVLEQVIVDLRAAVKLAPCNGQAWSDLSYVLSVWSHHDRGRIRELGQEAQGAADQALARSEVVPEFWVRRGVALDMQGRRGEAGEALARALTLAPANGKIWYYQAFHLGLNRSDLPLALAAVNFCLRLDPGNTEAQSLRQRLASGRPAP